MNRFEQFFLLFATRSLTADIQSGHMKTADALNELFDPNVKSMIEQGTDQTVIQKVNDYYQYVFFGAPKPFWFVKSTEGKTA